jgi:membrane fusion protein (multidrug efflux system)
MRPPALLPIARLLAVLFLTGITPAFAQFGPAGPPAVGVVHATKQPITESSQFIGRIQAVDRVSIVARVTAFLDQRFFTEGTEVKKGDLLYRLEQAPFQADLLAKQAAVAQANATLQNATITLGRAQSLLSTPAGQRSTFDDAVAAQRTAAAQLLAAQAQLQSSQINLNYTEIHSPIDGQIGRDQVTQGNVVSPSSGALNTIVSQDPMYVVFPVSLRTAIDLRNRYAPEGGFAAVTIKLRLPDGRLYDQSGKLNFVDNSVNQNTETLTLRGSIPNPVRSNAKFGDPGDRELSDGEFVTVLLQGVEPVEVIAVPRAAILSDQQGDYVYVVDAQNKVQQRRVTLGQSTPSTAVILSGLKEGETVVLEGLQRVRPGITVNPGPATPPPSLPPSVAAAPAASLAAPAASPSASTSTTASAAPLGRASNGPGGGAIPATQANAESRD